VTWRMRALCTFVCVLVVCAVVASVATAQNVAVVTFPPIEEQLLRVG
jgi:hypothetical protein